MKYTRIALCLILVFTMLAVVPKQAQAAYGDSTTIQFLGCSTNLPGDTSIGESQLTVVVTDVTVDPDIPLVEFKFLNSGPAASSITDIYFDDGTLLGIAQIIDDNGVTVDFEQYASPGNLPSAGCVVPPFEATAGFTADSEPPAQPNGVNPGEEVRIVFQLISGNTFADTIQQLTAGSTLRIGIHVQGFASGGSETFVSEGVTAVKLASFGARIKSGLVSIDWMTGAEISNAGFNVYRSASPTGARMKINKSLLGAHGNAASGASYSITDRPGYGTFFYWLEDIDLSGNATLHGPVSVNTLRSPIYRPLAPVMP